MPSALPAGGTSTLAGSLSIAAGEKYLGLWVYGDGSGNALTATTVDVSLRPQSFALTELNFTGWKDGFPWSPNQRRPGPSCRWRRRR